MEKVTYTKEQLLAFTKKELATISLSSGISFKLKKDDIVKEMMKVQKAEQKALKAQSEIKKEPSAKTKSSKEDSKEQVEEKVKEEIKVETSEKPYFHRPVRRRNVMTFR